MLKKSFLPVFGIIALAAVLAFSLAACGGGGGGAAPGSEKYPYLIRNAADLMTLADKVNAGDDMAGAYFKLTGDIDLSVLSLPTAGWTPIGTSSSPFSGNFDGDGHVISELFIYSTSGDEGLFGEIRNGSVKNLDVVLATLGITGGAHVGGVAANIRDSSISNCYVSGKVEGDWSVGGVAGWVGDDSKISDCYVTGEVNGNYMIGGIAGYLYGGEISNSHVVSSINSVTGSAGGVAGDVASTPTSNSTISNCYVAGNVTGGRDVGGIAGIVDSGSSTPTYSTISNCYSTGDVSATNEYSNVGGIAGTLNGTKVIVKNCYATGEVKGASSVGGVVGNFTLGTVENCLALNSSIVRDSYTYTSFGRVAGFILSGTPTNNLAISMPLPTGFLSGDDGDPITRSEAMNQAYYDGTGGPPQLGWDFDAPVWKWSATPTYPLPILNWQTTTPTLPVGHTLFD